MNIPYGSPCKNPLEDSYNQLKKENEELRYKLNNKLENKISLKERIYESEWIRKIGKTASKVAIAGSLTAVLFGTTAVMGYGLWHKLTLGELVEHVQEGFPGKTYEVKP
jgi:hypothetical protein